MGRLTCVTGCDKNFAKYLPIWKRHVEERGYDYIIYDLGGLGEGIPLDVKEGDTKSKGGFVPCNFKPYLIADAIQRTNPVVYMDIDAIVFQNIDEVFEKDFSIGATRRKDWEVKKYKYNLRVGTYNTGVLFFRASQETREFIKEWKRALETWPIEQQAFNAIAPRFKIEDFPTSVYNNYYFDWSGRPKIIHYKSGHKKRMLKL